jgi:hypothetical protein
LLFDTVDLMRLDHHTDFGENGILREVADLSLEHLSSGTFRSIQHSFSRVID